MFSLLCFFVVSMQVSSSQFVTYRVPRNIISSPVMNNGGTNYNAAPANNVNTIAANMANGNFISSNGNFLTANNLANFATPYSANNGNFPIRNGNLMRNGNFQMTNGNFAGVTNVGNPGLINNGFSEGINMGNVPVNLGGNNFQNVIRFGLPNGPATGGCPGNPPYGFQIVTDDLQIGGQVAVKGRMPLMGTVAVNSRLPTDGSASVNYGCGRGINFGR